VRAEKSRAVLELSPPTYETSVSAFTSTRRLINVISEKAQGYLYTRVRQPHGLGCRGENGCLVSAGGLKTLALRMEKHNQNGMQVALFLAEHRK